VDESSSQFSVLSSELRTFLAQSLPDYMIPAAFVELDALPQTANGKLDRKALPAPAAERPELEQAFTAASTPTEQQLAAIWADVLGVAQVGVHDSFFELGGHSLLATKVLYRVQQSFGIEPPLHLFFEEPTIARLAAAIDQYQTRPATPSRPTITARARGRQSVDQLVSRLERPAGAPSPAPRERMRGAADHDEA
jgi:acyl carrier protein